MKKPILNSCDSYQLEPFEYQWAWDMAREQENNTWTPEEIQVSADIALYRSGNCPVSECHLFEALMSQLTTFDIQRGDDAAETFLQIIQPAELKHYLKRLIWDEALHTRSYRYIIENLGIDLEIYNRWKTVPAIKARIDYANQISSGLHEILWDLYAAEHELLGSKTFVENVETFWDIDRKQTILYSMIFWFMIFEGIWFMLNLKGPLQALARRGLFLGAAEQFQYIARDEQSHVQFGHNLIKEFLNQHPEIWTKDFKVKIIQLFYNGIQLEEDYAKYCQFAGPILGYSIIDHVETARFFANLKAKALGLPEFFPYASHRFPWMSEQIELRKEKNFFETRPTEYQTGGALAWDEADPYQEDMFSHLNQEIK